MLLKLLSFALVSTESEGGGLFAVHLSLELDVLGRDWAGWVWVSCFLRRLNKFGSVVLELVFLESFATTLITSTLSSTITLSFFPLLFFSLDFDFSYQRDWDCFRCNILSSCLSSNVSLRSLDISPVNLSHNSQFLLFLAFPTRCSLKRICSSFAEISS